ncbi:MAG: hypothetical protein ACI9O4_000002 [Chitinophagales bacterium]|jgi:uncharacterized protein YyaL (SSP411 family)
MKYTLIYILFSLFVFSSCAQTSEVDNSVEMKEANHLINESSPYLLQHAYNPVDWYPWGEEALKKAKEENKLILVSIGYAACHWCHVMEHESFEDEEVAAYMNEHFVAIKVDREERPDIDQVYMDAVQLLSGSGGWPLNCIALPDGRPVYGGTYFPKKQWMNLLTQVGDFVKNNPEKAEEQANALTAGIQSTSFVAEEELDLKHTKGDLDFIWENWAPKMDFTLGGNDRSPKFPLPVSYQYLLHYHYLSNKEEALNITTLTLNKMAEGGIYDQIGGGFARYSTDAKWKVPHFEKMLYDNGQLVSLYARTYQQTKDPYYKEIIQETIDFIEREMTSLEGGFYSSLDADSEGEEGKFYVWQASEMDEVLGKDNEWIKDYYNVSTSGNWESNNILFITQSKEKIANKYELSIEELNSKLKKAKEVLLEERAKRIRPGLDDKILCSWNALMLNGYIDAYRCLGEDEYLKTAEASAAFMLSKFKKEDGGLYRNYKNGNASINGFLDDYAFTIQAFHSLYQTTFDEQWLIEADELMQYALTHFYDESTGLFYYTSDLDKALIARKIEVTDNVIPSANSELAKGLYVLGKLLYKEDYLSKSSRMMNKVKQQTPGGMSYFANWDILLAWEVSEPYEVVIVGKNAEEKRKEFDQYYLPNVFFAGGRTEGELEIAANKLVKGATTIYVCQNKVCQLPTESVEEALKQISK